MKSTSDIEKIQKVLKNNENQSEQDITTNINKDNKSSIKEIHSSPFRSKGLLITIVWSLFMLIFLFLSIYYFILNIIDYLQYDTTTSIQTIYEKESQFPTVSFCSRFEKNFEIKTYSFWFNNEKQHIEKDLQVYFDPLFGKCYRFNSEKMIKYSKKSGWDDGLILNFYSKTTFDFGELIISIHNHTQTSTTIYNKGYFISSGCKNYFIIKRIYDNKLEKPYNDCFKNVSKSEFNQTIINYLKSKNFAYNQKDCVNLCKNLKYNETNTCECYLDSLDDEIFIKCYNSSILTKCIDKFLNYYSLKHINECESNYCPLECDSFEYDIDLYQQSILSSGKISPVYNTDIDYPADFKTYENVSKTYFSINVYYQDLKYTLISQQPKIEIFGLISNLGGILGLFIGFAFVSLLAEALIELFHTEKFRL
jgi:hypothetical protein